MNSIDRLQIAISKKRKKKHTHTSLTTNLFNMSYIFFIHVFDDKDKKKTPIHLVVDLIVYKNSIIKSSYSLVFILVVIVQCG